MIRYYIYAVFLMSNQARKILLIDDDVNIRGLYVDVLQEEHYDVRRGE